MESDRKIGKVVSVNTFSATIELDGDLQSFVKNSYHGTHRIGLINSYIIIPIGADKIVGMVHSVSLNEETELNYKNSATLILPRSKRIMKVTMIGSIVTKRVDGAINKSEFEYGIVTYPQLDNPVWSVAESELEVIFRTSEKEPKNLITLGKSSIFPDYDVKLDMDNFFGKHAAILGNTGSGKSCTVTAIIRSVLEDKSEMKNAHFVIFDTNNEYEAAFSEYSEDGLTLKSSLFNRLVIRGEGFKVPHWFMDSSDYQTLFRPSEQVQAPILQRAIEKAKQINSPQATGLNFLDLLETTLLSIKSYLSENGKTSGSDIQEVSKSLSVAADHYKEMIDIVVGKIADFDANTYFTQFKSISEIAPPRQGVFPQKLLAEHISKVHPIVKAIETQLLIDKSIFAAHIVDHYTNVTVDTPSKYAISTLPIKLDEEITLQSHTDNRMRANTGTLVMRINHMLSDPRYNFLFNNLPFDNALSLFLRYILGENPTHSVEGKDAPNTPWMNYYDNQKAVSNQDPNPNRHRVTLIDFSGIASDVLENTTALVGRLIFEFMQRIENRGSFPVVLVLEEAHHYIPEHAQTTRQERARQVFERIAKEGRKFGLSLLVASQRPSELSRTVIAQCNSFIVHRIQNPEDQQYFRSVVSSISHDLLNQLPTLPQQSALVMGDCVTAPVQVTIRTVNPRPNSNDPSFSKEWSKVDFVPPDFEKISADWESGK